MTFISKLLILIVALAYLPNKAQCQEVNEIENCISFHKSKNFKYYTDWVENEFNSEYTFVLDEADVLISGNLKLLQFENTKKNKYLALPDKKLIFNCIEGLCLKHGLKLQYASFENGTFTFKKEEEDGYDRYFELYIPDTSEDYLQVVIMHEAEKFEIQDSIVLRDKSFEEYKYPFRIDPYSYKKQETPFNAWINYAPEYSPPELHFSDEINWGFKHPASEGNKYISLVTRDDESYEVIGQKLTSPLENDSSYMMSFDIRFDDRYKSGLKNSNGAEVYFDTYVCLKITISMESDYINQTIFLSPPIKNRDWKQINFQFVPDRDYDVIKFEAVNNTGVIDNGNLMIDNLSNIYKIGFVR